MISEQRPNGNQVDNKKSTWNDSSNKMWYEIEIPSILIHPQLPWSTEGAIFVRPIQNQMNAMAEK